MLNININIPKNNKVDCYKTGSGKPLLILLHYCPQKGSLEVDDQIIDKNNIRHVQMHWLCPQIFIYLMTQ